MCENENAYWIEKRQVGGGYWDFYFVCSSCKHQTPERGYSVAPDFCPGCGKKMESNKYVCSFDGVIYKSYEILNNIHTDEELERAANTLLTMCDKSEIKIGIEYDADLMHILDFDFGDLCIKQLQENAGKLYGDAAQEWLKYAVYDEILDLNEMVKKAICDWTEKRADMQPKFKYVKFYREFKRETDA